MKSDDIEKVKAPSKSGDETERGNWGSQLDFLLSCVGYAVGLGNLWRFPYLCMRNGGGAFLIPYFFFLFVCGIPLFFMELAIGQFASLSPLAVWKVCPLFKGLGWGMVAVSWVCCLYYNIIITWVLYFLGMSFTKNLPWASCDNDWNTPDCYTRTGNNSMTISNETVYDVSEGNAAPNITNNVTALMEIIQSKKKTSAEEFWQYNVLELSAGIHEMGGIRWELFGCLIAAWCIIFICLCKGIKSSGKVVYVTATVPYIFLVILLIRGLMLPGSGAGIRYYITPQWSKLLEFQVWGEACLQIFYSLGPAWGGLITMASYNKFNNNCLRDAIFVPVMNCGTSFFAGFVIFSIIGFLAHEANLPIDKVITSGPGLAFIAYPEAITRLPFSPFWAVLFFIMLLTLGLDSQFGMFETMTSGFVDEFPKYLKNHKMLFTGVTCVFSFFLGIPIVSKAGMYVFQIMDWYCAAFSVMVIAMLECIVLAWIYGIERLSYDIELMIGRRPGLIWQISWRFTTPGIMLLILVFSCFRMDRPTYGDYTYPEWAIGIGWGIAMFSLIPIPTVAVAAILRHKGSLLQRVRKCLKPTDDWGPAVEHYRQIYKYAKYNNNISLRMTADHISDIQKLNGAEEPVKKL